MRVRVSRDRANSSCCRERCRGCDKWIIGARVRDSISIALQRSLFREVSGAKTKAGTTLFSRASFGNGIRIEIIGQSTQAPGGAPVEVSRHLFALSYEAYRRHGREVRATNVDDPNISRRNLGKLPKRKVRAEPTYHVSPFKTLRHKFLHIYCPVGFLSRRRSTRVGAFVISQ